jgi:two-component system phosphate regulon response regulator PhoB
MSRILVVDDEKDLRSLLDYNLTQAGFTVQTAQDAREAISKVKGAPPDLVILDLLLPDLPGTDVLKAIKREHPELPVLMLTAKGEEVDRLVGFELGADDYVVKPFSVRELVMRVGGMARRFHERRAARSITAQTESVLRWRGLEVDVTHHRVFSDGAELSLRPLEFKLIHILLGHPRRLFSRGELLASVWGISSEVTTRTVDTHVRRLRERLGPYSEAVETVHGYGYRLRDP